MKLRVKKFGAQTENTKKEIRAQRFGAPNSEKGDASLLEKRAQRFGTAAGTAAEGKVDNDLLEKRAKRFGTAANGASPDGKVYISFYLAILVDKFNNFEFIFKGNQRGVGKEKTTIWRNK